MYRVYHSYPHYQNTNIENQNTNIENQNTNKKNTNTNTQKMKCKQEDIWLNLSKYQNCTVARFYIEKKHQNYSFKVNIPW